MRIALTSSGPLSGKTTLAKYLEQKYGFVRADHSRTLVSDFVWNYNSVSMVSSNLKIEDVYADKERWRPELQQWNEHIGFSLPKYAKYWIRNTLDGLLSSQHVVFDSFRGETQAGILHELGFVLVQLEITDIERCIRAGEQCQQVMEAIRKAPEIERGIARPDIRLNGHLPVDQVARNLLQEASNVQW